jgi:SET domain-containing protein
MMCVKTRLRPSGIHGVGLFADEPIAAGMIVWKFDEGLDQRFSEDFYATRNALLKEFLFTYAWLDVSGWILCGDDARFVNHSALPNLGGGKALVSIALRDIPVGEELTEDYEMFDLDFVSYRENLL